MSEDWMLWGLFILLGLVTTLPRASFIVLGERAALPETLHRALRYAPAAALAAIAAGARVTVVGRNPESVAEMSSLMGTSGCAIAGDEKAHAVFGSFEHDGKGAELLGTEFDRQFPVTASVDTRGVRRLAQGGFD